MNPTDPSPEADLETRLRRVFHAVARAPLGDRSADVTALSGSPLRSLTGGRRGLNVATLTAVAAVAAFVVLFIAYGPQNGSPAHQTTPAGQSPTPPIATVPTTNPPGTTVTPTTSTTPAPNEVTASLPVVRCPTDFAITTPPPTTPVPLTWAMRVPTNLRSTLAVYTDTNHIEIVLAPRGWNCRAFYGADGSGSINVYPSGQPAPGPTSEVAIEPRSSDEAVTLSETGGSPVIAASTACPYFSSAAAQTQQYGIGGCSPSVNAVEPISQDAVGLAIPAGRTAPGIPSGGLYVTNVVVLYTATTQPGSYLGSCTLPQSEHGVCTAVLNDIVARYGGK